MITAAESVKIRPVELDDAQAICDAITESKGELRRWFWWAQDDIDHTNIAEQRERTASQIRAWAERKAYEFAIVDVRDGALLGRCGINDVIWQPGSANLGYWVRTSRYGQGIAPAAVRQVVRFGFEELGLHRLELVIDVDNAASIRVAEKVGAVFEGVLRNRTGLRVAPRPARMYSLVPGDLAEN
jgi:RimJ/RimL family protein N-acetyltransferase